MTVRVALTEASEANGCMQMLPGSQVDGIAPQCDFWDTNNLSTTVQTIDANVDKSREVQATLQSCEVSFHHIDICHASKPNETNDWRVVWALRHITPADRQKRVDTDFATLLKGEDYCGQFQPEALPITTMHLDAVVKHPRIANIQDQIYLNGTDCADVSGLIETNEGR